MKRGVLPLFVAAFVAGAAVVGVIVWPRGPASASEILAEADRNSKAMMTASFSLDASIVAAASDEQVRMRAEGVMAPPKLSMSGTMIVAGTEVPFSERLVDDKAYMRVGADNTWYVTGLEFSDPVRSAMSGTGDPGALLSILGGEPDVRDLGTEAVSGIDCRHLAFDIDGEAFSRVISSENTAVAAEVKKLYESTTVRVEAWVGAEDAMPYRLDMVFEATEPEPSTMRMRLEFADFDVPVLIEAPLDAKPLPKGKAAK